VDVTSQTVLTLQLLLYTCKKLKENLCALVGAKSFTMCLLLILKLLSVNIYSLISTGKFQNYLFFNRGVPQYVGCIQRLMHWLPGYLLAWGSVAMVLAGIQLVLFALALMLAASRKSEGGHDVVHHERIEVIERQ
jgi:hypothetical protein